MKKIRNIIIALIVIIFILIVGYVTYQYVLLINLYELKENNKVFSNIYFKQISNSQTIEYYGLDNIVKVSFKQNNDDGDILAWNDYENNEYYTLFNNDNTYNTKHSIEYDIPIFNRSNNMSSIDKLLFAINPTKNISTLDYNGYECYKIEDNNYTVYIDKSTFIVVYEKINNEETITNYEINSVTEDDVSKPDITNYVLKEL